MVASVAIAISLGARALRSRAVIFVFVAIGAIGAIGPGIISTPARALDGKILTWHVPTLTTRTCWLVFGTFDLGRCTGLTAIAQPDRPFGL
ncbi:hypothetical protein PG990_014473 [Apiospora arundinis]